MLLTAIKMMVGDKAKFLGILLGLTFASFIIIQQTAILIGIIYRTYGFITDIPQVDLWVMNKKVQYIDDIKPLKITELYRVQGVDGVEWAVPLFKGAMRARLPNGIFQTCNVIGIDDATLIGGPPVMVEGTIYDLREPDGVIVDQVGATTKLAVAANKDHASIPLKVGDVLELNDRRAKVVGICKTTRTFQSQPIIFTTFTRAINFTPKERNLLSFILVKVSPHVNPELVEQRIRTYTNLTAYSDYGFKKLTLLYFLKYTGIFVNFGFAVFLGFIIGVAIAGQTFYNFAHDNIIYFAAIKAMGATNRLLIKMVLTQACLVAVLAWGIGMGLVSLFGLFSLGTELSFKLPWYLYIGSGCVILLISLFSAMLSLITIVRTDPAIVFQR